MGRRRIWVGTVVWRNRHTRVPGQGKDLELGRSRLCGLSDWSRLCGLSDWSRLCGLPDWSGLWSALRVLPDWSGLWGLPDWSRLWGFPDWSSLWSRLCGLPDRSRLRRLPDRAPWGPREIGRQTRVTRETHGGQTGGNMAPTTNNKPCAQHTETSGGRSGHTSRTMKTS